MSNKRRLDDYALPVSRVSDEYTFAQPARYTGPQYGLSSVHTPGAHLTPPVSNAAALVAWAVFSKQRAAGNASPNALRCRPRRHMTSARLLSLPRPYGCESPRCKLSEPVVKAPCHQCGARRAVTVAFPHAAYRPAAIIRLGTTRIGVLFRCTRRRSQAAPLTLDHVDRCSVRESHTVTTFHVAGVLWRLKFRPMRTQPDNAGSGDTSPLIHHHVGPTPGMMPQLAPLTCALPQTRSNTPTP